MSPVVVTAFETVWLKSRCYDTGGSPLCYIVQTDWYLNGATLYFFRGDSTGFSFHDSLATQTVKIIIRDNENHYASLTVNVSVVPKPTGRQYYLTDHLGRSPEG